MVASPGTQVRQGVNKTIADLTAWSLHYGGLGVYPERGFYGEEFEKGTYRAGLAGKPLANGFKYLGSNGFFLQAPSSTKGTLKGKYYKHHVW